MQRRRLMMPPHPVLAQLAWEVLTTPPTDAEIHLLTEVVEEAQEQFFVGSLVDGAIWRGDLRTGSGAVLADGAPGRVSVGIAYEAARNQLWVAGGGPGFRLGVGDVRVYDASSGDLLATFLPPGDVGALNDVAITHDAVYVTDSFNAQLVRIPLPGRCHRRTQRRCCRSLAPSSRPHHLLPTSMELSPRAVCSSWRRPARGSSSASTLTLGSPTSSTLAARSCPARTVWSCEGTRSMWSVAAL
jgi:hypothetical protein